MGIVRRRRLDIDLFWATVFYTTFGLGRRESMFRTRSRQVTLAEVLGKSGLHPQVLNFAMWCGFRFTSADQSLDEQVASLCRKNPMLSHDDALAVIGNGINEDVAEFFNKVFPVVARNRAP